MTRAPEGYGLIAKTDMFNGATVVRAYMHLEEHSRILVLAEYATAFGGRTRVMLGPFDRRVLQPMILTLKDVESMTSPNFLGDE